MLKNYIKIAWRNLVKGKLYSAINIIGLAVGMACCLMIGLYVYEELRYDRFHEKAGRIYRVNYTLSGETSAQTPKPLAAFMRGKFSKIKEVVSVEEKPGVVRVDGRLFEKGFLVTGAAFFDVFDFEVLRGNPEVSMTHTGEVFLSESTARKYFGNRSALGKTIELRIDGTFYQASVAGIVEDAPDYSSIQYQVLVPRNLWLKAFPESEQSNNWRTWSGVRFIEVTPGTDPEVLSSNLTKALLATPAAYFTSHLSVDLQNIQNIHLGEVISPYMAPPVNPGFVYISVIIGILILFIACINFTSLSIGHSAHRAREVGMRKAMGAYRSQLMGQFWGETLLVTLFALALGLLLTELLLPYFGMLMGQPLELGLFGNPMLLILVGGIVLLTGLLAGSYPALYLSKFRPSQVFRNKVNVEGNYSLIRILTSVQFLLAVVLITGTLLMNRQMNLLQNKSLGFNEEYVIQVETPWEEGRSILKNMRIALENQPDILGISGSWEGLGPSPVGFQALPVEADGKEIRSFSFGTDPRLPEILELEVVAGRSLRENVNLKQAREVLVNEEFVEAFGWKDPLGKQVSSRFDFENATVVGVVRDFHFQSMHHPIGPLVIYPMDYVTTMYVRIQSGQIQRTLNRVEEAWKASANGLPFHFTFLDDRIEQQYREDQRWAQLVELASVIAIVIAAMGLFGLATLASVRRAREISIRKVLGATVASLVGLMSKDFLKPVVLGLVIALPLSYILLSQWLQNFAYRIDMDIGVFVLAGLLTILIALGTVSWQSVRAALVNPAESLRNE